jgi:hypothetical protein
MKKLIILLAVASIFTVPAHSTMKKVAQTGLQFLKVDVVARAAAMGGAFMMIGDDATAMFYNPAGIALMSHSFDFFSGRTNWIAEINYNAVGAVKNLGNWGAVGFSAITSDYGDIIGTQVAQSSDSPTDIEKGFVETGMIDVGAYAVGLTYARSLTNKFTVGGQIKYVSQHLGENILNKGDNPVENKVSGYAFDFGTIFYPGFQSLRVGMSIRNFSGQFQYEETPFQLPLTFTVSAAMDVLDLMGEHESPLLLAIDAVHPRDYTERIQFGGEYLFMGMFALRAGYKFNYDEEGLTAGIGLKYTISRMNLKLDYAYGNMDIFDSVNRFSIGISF